MRSCFSFERKDLHPASLASQCLCNNLNMLAKQHKGERDKDHMGGAAGILDKIALTSFDYFHPLFTTNILLVVKNRNFQMTEREKEN